eukprot:7386007-Prymnesium_polylepis.1
MDAEDATKAVVDGLYDGVDVQERGHWVSRWWYERSYAIEAGRAAIVVRERPRANGTPGRFVSALALEHIAGAMVVGPNGVEVDLIDGTSDGQTFAIRFVPRPDEDDDALSERRDRWVEALG